MVRQVFWQRIVKSFMNILIFFGRIKTERRNGRNAYEHVKDKFTWERAAKEYLEEFNDLKSHR